MSTYKTVRGKLVQLAGPDYTVILKSDPDGALHVRVTAQEGALNEVLDLPENAASDLYNLLGDVMEWESSRGLTESQLEKAGEPEASTGELDDINAASNK